MKIAILTSGAGGDFLALLKAHKCGVLKNLEFQFVLSTVADSISIDNAKQQNIRTIISNVKAMGRKEFDSYLENLLIEVSPDIICLCGFKYLLNNNIVMRFHNKIINSHSSLLPAFPGIVKKERMLLSSTKILGATVHIVDDTVDLGPQLIQAAFPNPGIKQLDSTLKLYRNLQDALYLQAVRWMGKVTMEQISLEDIPQHTLYYKGILFVPSIDEDILSVTLK